VIAKQAAPSYLRMPPSPALIAALRRVIFRIKPP
jgi:hypothetical protein